MRPNDDMEQMVAMLAMKELEDRKARKSHMFILLRHLHFIILNQTCVKMLKTHFSVSPFGFIESDEIVLPQPVYTV
jgi:hypothetical protein